MSLAIIVLAAGQSNRMHSATPKVLHTIGNKPMLAHVLDSAFAISPHVYAVIGHQGDTIRSAFADYAVHWVQQTEQLGTGHAVAQVLPLLPDHHKTLMVLYGDVPLVRTETLHCLAAGAKNDQLAVLTAIVECPDGYGRIMRNKDGAICGIVEHADATPAQLAEKEINTGLLAASTASLRKWTQALTNHNQQKEYYLTDIIAQAHAQNTAIVGIQTQDAYEAMGVNHRGQLVAIERQWQHNMAHQFMERGLKLADAHRFDLRGNLTFGRDVFIDINVVIKGDVHLGDGVYIAPNCLLIGDTCPTQIADKSTIHANSIIEDSVVGEECTIGPFARLRPGTELAREVRIGNFVETKKSSIQTGSKINHLSYVGDAQVGQGVNIGAGTITCNYDGINKNPTIIEEKVFVGSNCSLVAPLKIGKHSTIGAGCTITKDVPADALGLGRAAQHNIAGWHKKKNRPPK